MIEGLLDQIALLRQKVRSLGDDNSRLRRELLQKHSQELMLYGRMFQVLGRWHKRYSIIYVESDNSHDQPGASFNDIRVVTQRFTPPEGELKLGSPKESDLSAYSCESFTCRMRYGSLSYSKRLPQCGVFSGNSHRQTSRHDSIYSSGTCHLYLGQSQGLLL